MIDLTSAAGPRLALALRARADGLAVRVMSAPGDGSPAEALLVLQPPEEALSMLAQPTFHESLGRGLFRALSVEPVGAGLRAALADAAQAGQPLALELHFEEGALAAASYPWELLHDGARFLLHAGALTVVRCVPVRQAAVTAPPITAPRPGEPLTLLSIRARPADHAPLRVEGPALSEALASWIAADRVDVAELLPPTWDALREWVLAGAPELLHLECASAGGPEAALLLEAGGGASDPVSADLLGTLLAGSRLRLALWIGARSPGDPDAAAVAAALVRAGFPAVVALPYALPADPPQLTARFVTALYAALLDGAPLETACEQARRTLNRSAAWHLPALYRQVPQAVVAGEDSARRVELIVPRRAEAHLPLRAGLWLLSPDAPPPDPAVIERLLACSPQECAPGAPAAVATFHAGPVQVAIEAEGCELHGDPAAELVVMPDADISGRDARPLWFGLTPRRGGPLTLRVTLSQAGETVASVTRTLESGTAAPMPAQPPAVPWSVDDLLREGTPPPPDDPTGRAVTAGPESVPEPVRVPVEIARLGTTEVPVLVERPYEGWLRWGLIALALIALAVIVLLLLS